MREASSNVSQHALEQRDYDTLPPAPQEQSLLSRVADTLRTFCPRVFGINEHFSQESALREPFFRAPDWTYTGSHACLDASIHMPTQGSLQALPVFSTLAAHDLYSCLRSHPRLSALFKSSHMQAHTLAYAHKCAHIRDYLRSSSLLTCKHILLPTLTCLPPPGTQLESFVYKGFYSTSEGC
jgi:hypothetical protein